MMSMTNDERGSVLMEFIVVLPIYMLLLGFAFVVGEFSLDAIHLAGAGDRSRAFSSGEYDASTEPFEKYKLAASPDREAWDNGVETEFSYSGDADMGGSAKVSEYENTDSRVYVADGEIAGPWVEMAAGMVVDSFTLPPWTRGIVAFWYRREYNMTDMPKGVDDAPVGKILSRAGSRRTDVVGKDLSANGGDVRKFGFYTLRRLARREGWDVRLPFRTWGDGQLVDTGYWRIIAGEKFPEGDSSGYEGVDYGEDPGSPALPWKGEDVCFESVHYYDRDEELREYSTP